MANKIPLKATYSGSNTSGLAEFQSGDTIDAGFISGGLAPLTSPTFTGTPTAPTAAVTTNTTQLATTAFVRGEVTALVASAPGTLDTLNELAEALGDDANFSTTVTNSIATKLSLSGGTMTGKLTLPQAGLDLPVNNTYITGAGHKVLQVDATRTYLYGGSASLQFRNAANTATTVDITDSGNVTVTGSCTATSFSGDGSALTNLPAGGVAGITSASSSGTAINIGSANIIGIGTTGGPGQLNVNSGIANTIAKFESGDDNGFIQIEDDDTTGYVDVQNGWISIGGYASALHANNLSVNVSDGRGLSQFTAKAWLTWNGSSNSIRDSHNISSVGNWGTGSYGLYFSNSLANANYAAVGMGTNQRILAGNTGNSGPWNNRFDFRSFNDGGSWTNSDYEYLVFFGD